MSAKFTEVIKDFSNKQDTLVIGNLTGTLNQIEISNGLGTIIGTGVTISLPTNVYIVGDIYSKNKIVVMGTGTIGQVAQFDSSNTITGITEKTAFNVNFETDLGNIKPDGSVSLGALNTVARADHIHQTFTVQESNMFLNDVSSLNSSISKHGFLPRLSGNGVQYLDGNGNFTTPTIGSFSGTITSNVATITTDYAILTSDKFLYVTSSGKTLTLPTTSGTVGSSFTIDNASTGYIYLNALSSGLIQGEYTQTIPSDSSISVYNPGTGNWRIY